VAADPAGPCKPASRNPDRHRRHPCRTASADTASCEVVEAAPFTTVNRAAATTTVRQHPAERSVGDVESKTSVQGSNGLYANAAGGLRQSLGFTNQNRGRSAHGRADAEAPRSSRGSQVGGPSATSAPRGTGSYATARAPPTPVAALHVIVAPQRHVGSIRHRVICRGARLPTSVAALHVIVARGRAVRSPPRARWQIPKWGTGEPKEPKTDPNRHGDKSGAMAEPCRAKGHREALGPAAAAVARRHIWELLRSGLRDSGSPS